MRQNGLQVWHRCGTCGTIFSDLQELRSHLAQHTGPRRRVSPVDEQARTDTTGIPARGRKLDPELSRIADVTR